MKKITLVFILFSISKLVSAQNNYFVNDVQYVNDVEIDFCIDSIGRVYDVQVNKDFTDYNNNEVIQEIIIKMQELSIPNVELYNDCHKELFTFINDSLQFSKIEEKDFKHLEKYRIGKFSYAAPRLRSIKIIRKKNKQIEKEEDGVYSYEINWIAPNLYTLKYLEVGNKQLEYLIGELIEVEIIRIIDENSYVYRSRIKGIQLYGIIKKT